MRKKGRQNRETPKKQENVRVMIVSKGTNFSVWIEGARKMLLCLSDSVRVLLEKDVLCLKGKGLTCITYGGGGLEVTGYIEEIRFEPWRLRGRLEEDTE